jgi:Amt family ammonium transporter
VLSCAVYVFLSSLIFWSIIKATMGLRVGLQEEIEGLDIGEHGNSAYPEFLIRKPSYTFLGIKSEK